MQTMVEEAAAELGGLDGYVHTPSGGFRPIDPQQIDPGLWDLAMNSTAKGFLFAAQAAFAAMLPNRHGVILAVNDVAARQPWPRFAHHAAAKAAQAQLIKCLAAAWGQDGIRVCGVAPGPVLMPEGIAGNPDETALRRLGSPDDVAGAIRYLFEAEFVTGTILVVDGGRLLRP
jgi:NAD(P)-dependent dehydrogenase (short-subunit alcohol dehydrogenase family)